MFKIIPQHGIKREKTDNNNEWLNKVVGWDKSKRDIKSKYRLL